MFIRWKRKRPLKNLKQLFQRQMKHNLKNVLRLKKKRYTLNIVLSQFMNRSIITSCLTFQMQIKASVAKAKIQSNLVFKPYNVCDIFYQEEEQKLQDKPKAKVSKTEEPESSPVDKKLSPIDKPESTSVDKKRPSVDEKMVCTDKKHNFANFIAIYNTILVIAVLTVIKYTTFYLTSHISFFIQHTNLCECLILSAATSAISAIQRHFNI